MGHMEASTRDVLRADMILCAAVMPTELLHRPPEPRVTTGKQIVIHA